eukprot:TRINITY_DN13359_c0_g3_i1.p1 TRINITY_DN13359_c0_g3~~TRINITY_DN13359_c0_g3_i1.p1  ORF type:complete len:226 (-),score=15.67 TRINITY_DN13359_c0_g3_i1:32-631(-)
MADTPDPQQQQQQQEEQVDDQEQQQQQPLTAASRAQTMFSTATTAGVAQFRVKVYELNPAQTWDDQGTGYVTCVEDVEVAMTGLEGNSAHKGAIIGKDTTEEPSSSSAVAAATATAVVTLVLNVRSEEGDRILLEHSVSPKIDYVRQGETIITWYEEATNRDLALSFQQSIGCNAIWAKVQDLKKRAGVDAHDGEGMSR